jgi:hypothetical protein
LEYEDGERANVTFSRQVIVRPEKVREAVHVSTGKIIGMTLQKNWHQSVFGLATGRIISIEMFQSLLIT